MAKEAGALISLDPNNCPIILEYVFRILTILILKYWFLLY